MAKKEVSIEKQESKELESVERTRSGKVFVPPVDIIETDKDLRLLVDMPGVDKDAINITLEQDILTIEGFVEPEKLEGFELEYLEYEVGDYHRSFNLSSSINKAKIEASFKNGVLELLLPKTELEKPKRINITSN
jgi:HSP20 family molecular chaperone IbpA